MDRNWRRSWEPDKARDSARRFSINCSAIWLIARRKLRLRRLFDSISAETKIRNFQKNFTSPDDKTIGEINGNNREYRQVQGFNLVTRISRRLLLNFYHPLFLATREILVLFSGYVTGGYDTNFCFPLPRGKFRPFVRAGESRCWKMVSSWGRRSSHWPRRR